MGFFADIKAYFVNRKQNRIERAGRLIKNPKAIRDDRWKLIRYPNVDKTQLFDLKADPEETQNLADDPIHTDHRARLTQQLIDGLNEAGETERVRSESPDRRSLRPPPRRRP